MNIANLVTVARLLSVPVVLYCLLHGEMRLAFYVFLFSCV